jgi:hypothetical protein
MLKGTSRTHCHQHHHAVVAAALFASPWLFSFSAVQAASWNAWICGLAIAALALAAINEPHEWEEWGDAAWVCGQPHAPWVSALQERWCSVDPCWLAWPLRFSPRSSCGSAR